MWYGQKKYTLSKGQRYITLSLVADSKNKDEIYKQMKITRQLDVIHTHYRLHILARWFTYVMLYEKGTLLE